MGLPLAPGLTQDKWDSIAETPIASPIKVDPKLNIEHIGMEKDKTPLWKNPTVGAMATGAASIGYNALSGGYSTTGGSLLNSAGDIAAMAPMPWGPAASVLLKGAGAIVNRGFGTIENKENIANAKNQTAAAFNTNYDANSWDSFMQQDASNPMIALGDKSDYFKDGWWTNNGGKEFAAMQKEAIAANAWSNSSRENNAENLNMDQFQNAMMDYMNPTGTNFGALGGLLDTHGAEFNLPLNEINEGGSHEENPYGGIQVGVDKDGVPNLVEEGETIYNNYVFSKRLKVPEEFRVKYSLGKKNKNLTFAEASKKLSKEIELSPHDNISKSTHEYLMQALAQAQEEVRAKQAAKKGIQSLQPNQMEAAFAYGGNIFSGNDYQQAVLSPTEAIMRNFLASQVAAAASTPPDSSAFAVTPLNASDSVYSPADQQDMNNYVLGQAGFGPAPSTIIPYAGMPNYNIPNGGVSGLPTPDGAYKDWNSFIGYNPEKKRYADGYTSNEFRDFYNNLTETEYRKYFNRGTLPNYFNAGNKAIADRETAWNLAHDMEKAMKDGKSGGLSDYHKAMGELYKVWASDKLKQQVSGMSKLGLGNSGDLSIDGKLNIDPKALATSTKQSIKQGADDYKASLTPSGTQKPGATTPPAGNNELPTKDNWLRYAPIVGSAIGLAHGLMSKPDYSNANAIIEASRSAGQYKPVAFSPIGDYMTYRPLDRQYGINQLNAQAGATQRNVLNTSGGNRGQAMAGLLAAGYNANMGIGNLLRQAEESNQAQRMQVANFNRGTNQYNSEGALKADMANQAAAQQSKQLGLSGLMQGMAMKEAIDTNRANSIAANFSNIFTSLGNIGTTNMNRYDRNWMMKYVHGMNTNEKTNTKACGGKINRRK